MAKMKYWDGKAWVILDAKDADTLDGKHASEFANKSSFDEHITNHPKGFSGNYNDLTNKPTSMPANGGNADTVDGKHASEFAASSHGTHVSYATATTALTSGGTGAVGTSGNVARQDHTHTLPAYPTSLPADGGNADTVDGKHASDFRPSNWTPTAADVGALALTGGTITGDTSFSQYVRFNAWPEYGTGAARLWYDGRDTEKALHFADIKHIKVDGCSVYHANNKPTPESLNAARSYRFDPGNLNARFYVRLITISKTDSHFFGFLCGQGDFGSVNRGNFFISVATRGNTIKCEVQRLTYSSADPTTFHTRDNGSQFEVWAYVADYNLPAGFLQFGAHQAQVVLDSKTTTKPSGATDVSVSQMFSTANRPYSRGTGDPSGGVDGDLYFKHS